MKKFALLTYIVLVHLLPVFAQEVFKEKAAGSLFIMGGGERSVELMKNLISTAQMTREDYIVVLPMSGENPDTSFYYIQKDLKEVCSNPVSNLNFTKETTGNKLWLDSVLGARLIFITGGDQNRFMRIVLHSPLQTAIQTAYLNGATIAGTSAGAAVMSKQMITGNELFVDTLRSGSFKKVQFNMVELKEGLGLIDSAIIDQHFITRSRYNRLLSVLAAYPSYTCIGIDEGTAIVVKNKQVSVVGNRQVVRMILPRNKQITPAKNGIIKMRDIRLDLLVDGDTFTLGENR